jgi:hypothetical protein
MKKKIPQIVKTIRNSPKIEIDWTSQKLVSYSQLSMFNECPKRWSLMYKEGHKVFTSTIHTVFGTALHNTLQHYLEVMYEKSRAAANRINTYELFEENMRNEYMTQYKKNNKVHFSNPQEIKEFFDDGIEIIRDFAKNAGKYFSKKGWHLVGCEIPITIMPDYKLSNVIFQGYLDIVMYHEPTNTIKIIDLKTSTSGWRDKEKKDENKQLQLVLYKNLFSEAFNFPIENIEVEFMILKRKLFESEEFVIRRIQIHKPVSGKTKINKSRTLLNNFIETAFSKEGFSNTELEPTINKNCIYCPYNKVHLCKATYES